MKMMTIIAVLTWVGLNVHATPYFRLLDPTHPQPVVGALFDLKGLGKTETTSLLPLITHSTADGCVLPKSLCEDWTPIAVGAAMNSGKITLDMGPLFNILPIVQQGALTVIPASWTGLIKILTPASGQAVTFSGGPIWEYEQLTNKGYFKIASALALHF